MTPNNQSPLRRLGNKARLLPALLKLFPEKISVFIDMFMGTGAVSFAMVNQARYIIANDIEKDIYNLFMVIKERKDELVQALTVMPVHTELFKHWKQKQESDPVWKAVRFLFLSNFGLYGTRDTLRLGSDNHKKITLENLAALFGHIKYIKFLSCDFKNVLPKIGFRPDEQDGVFIYADPPYLDTVNKYKTDWSLQHTQDLFQLLINSSFKFAISEFENPQILELADSYGLSITVIGERRTLRSRNTEILITNYEPRRNPRQGDLFFNKNEAADT